MKERYFVYILHSIPNPKKTYVGFTESLDDRLEEHNSGSQIYSSRYAPWQRVAYIGFTRMETALAFEKHLKTPSGKAFINKHLLQETATQV